MPPESDRQTEKRLPICAIIPVLNCAHRLRAHMEKSMEWLTSVTEIIVVDSHSEDGSLEIVQQYLGPVEYRVVQHPRGLYASWNCGVSHASCPYDDALEMAEQIEV